MSRTVNPWIIAVTVTLATLMEVLDTSIANVALPHIAGSPGPSSTGDRTSALPPENATGKYVKIVQRMPLRIRFRDNQEGLDQLDQLRRGMSVAPKIHFE